MLFALRIAGAGTAAQVRRYPDNRLTFCNIGDIIIKDKIYSAEITSNETNVSETAAETAYEPVVNDMNANESILTFNSFDGGGPEYSIVLDSDIVSYRSSVSYAKPDHSEMTGAGYTITYTFTGIIPGETEMTVEERSPVDIDKDHRYFVKVDNDLKVTIEELAVTEPDSTEEFTETIIP